MSVGYRPHACTKRQVFGPDLNCSRLILMSLRWDGSVFAICVPRQANCMCAVNCTLRGVHTVLCTTSNYVVRHEMQKSRNARFLCALLYVRRHTTSYVPAHTQPGTWNVWSHQPQNIDKLLCWHQKVSAEAVTVQRKFLCESGIFTQVISTTQHVVNPEVSRSSLSISTTRKFAKRAKITTRSQDDIVNVILSRHLIICMHLICIHDTHTHTHTRGCTTSHVVVRRRT